jgi:hypothetical protein
MHRQSLRLIIRQKQPFAEVERVQATTVQIPHGEIGPCPLCGQAATLIDWRPAIDWVVVQGCPCYGFFVGGRILETRLPSLPAGAHENLAQDVQMLRGMGLEVWCTTTNGSVGGRLVIRAERPGS